MKPVVLVTAIGTVTATAIVTELKHTNEFHIIGSDINPGNEIATSLDVDEFFVFPPITDMDAYMGFILSFCKEHRVRYYYAVLDKEVVSISKYRQKFLDIGTKLCVPNYEFCEICHFKNRFSQWIERNIPQIGIKTYGSYLEIHEGIFPLFIKPVEGVASSGCKKINNLNEFNAVVTPESIGTEIVVQDYIEGYHITVDLIRNRFTKQSIQIQRRELLRNANGCGIAVQILDDEKLKKICAELMEKLDLHGVANAEFFCSNGEYRIIEINPRFSAGSRYSCMAGVNTVLNALYIADGKECRFGQLAYGKHFAERYETYRMD